MSCRGGVGHVGDGVCHVGWDVSCRGGVVWVM